MEAIVILIWITVCLTAMTIGVLTALAIARYVQGYTTKQIASEFYEFMAPKEEELYWQAPFIF